MKKTLSYFRKVNRINKKINRKLTAIPRKVNSNNKKIKRRINKYNKYVDKQVKMINLHNIPVDTMTGEQFEYYIKKLYEGLGYNVRLTSLSNDFGADLILTLNDGRRRVVQAKRYSSKVGVKAVQEIKSAKKYYNADSTMVITNNFFTKPALKLAESNNVLLMDRNGLRNLIEKSEKFKAENQKEVIKSEKKSLFSRLFN